MANLSNDAKLKLLTAAAAYYADPLGFVMFNWPWGKPGTFLEHHSGPDEWQIQFLEELGVEIRKRAFDGHTAVDPVRMARASGHGIGKSVLSAMLATWILSTRPSCKGTITASSWTQLNTRTWATLTRWLGLGVTAPLFECTKDRIWFQGAKDSWFVSAQSCSPENSESFAGQHAADSTSFYIFDESSGIADKIFETATGGLSDGEPMMFLFGNPTQSSGFFHRACFGSDRNYWLARSISSWESRFTNKKQLAEWRTQWGETSDWYRVRVLGEPPATSFNQLIETPWVEAARKFKAPIFTHEPAIFGVDVARYGDDRSACVMRQGRYAQTLAIWRGLDTVQVGERVLALIEEHKPAAVIVDADGLGVGTFDTIKNRGCQKVHEFHGGGKSLEPNTYFNRRAEVWGLMRDWLKAGSCQIPDEAEFEVDLTGTQYTFTPKGPIQLEPKECLKSRGLASPDLADALAMTFAMRVLAPPERKPVHRQWIAETDPNLAWMIV